MAITTYAELQTAVANWLDRSDLTDRIPEFIALAETDINAQFNLRTIETETTLTPVVSSRYIALPTGFRQAMQLWLLWSGSAGRQDLRATLPEALNISTVNSVPSMWCVDGTNIAFDCPNTSASDYSFILRWMSGVGLSDSSTTNLILTNYPGVYLFGALKEAAPYLRDPDALAAWEAKYNDAITKAKAKENRDKGLVTLSTEPGQLSTRRPSFNIYRGT